VGPARGARPLSKQAALLYGLWGAAHLYRAIFLPFIVVLHTDLDVCGLFGQPVIGQQIF